MTDMEDKEWLKELKVGDKVFIVEEYYNQKSTKIASVERITPTGQIVIGNMRFKNGLIPSSDRWRTHYTYLKKYSEEEYNALKQRSYGRSILKKLKDIPELTFEQAKAIAEIMKW